MQETCVKFNIIRQVLLADLVFDRVSAFRPDHLQWNGTVFGISIGCVQFFLSSLCLSAVSLLTRQYFEQHICIWCCVAFLCMICMLCLRLVRPKCCSGFSSCQYQFTDTRLFRGPFRCSESASNFKWALNSPRVGAHLCFHVQCSVDWRNICLFFY